ncbi:MAG: hypothetical protein QXX08_10645 [Candidatus Bathyarchaeia archaeon]
MNQKSVTDLIFDRFAESIEKDDLFKGISADLVALVLQKRANKAEIMKILKGEGNENPKSGSQEH